MADAFSEDFWDSLDTPSAPKPSAARKPAAASSSARSSSKAAFSDDFWNQLDGPAAPQSQEPATPMVELPPESSLPAGHFDFKGGKGFEPAKRTRAVFTDITPSGEPGYTAEELGGAKEDTAAKSRTAFVGGALQGATLGFGDEAAALFSDKPYREARDENRAAFRTAQEGSPKDYAMGHLAGSAAMMMATPSLAPTAAKPLLSVANTARAAAGGAIAGLGESEADLTKGDLAGAAADTAKGAAIAAGMNAALGLAGKGVKAGKRFILDAPERVARKADDALIDAATLGAPATQRDALLGELGTDRPNVLALIKSNPDLRKAIEERRYTDAVNILRTSKTTHAAEDARTVAEIDRGGLSIDVAPVIGKMQQRLDALKANPSVESQAEAAALQKRIDVLNERYLPEEPLAFDAKRAKVAADPMVKRLEAERDAIAANPSAEAQADAAKLQKRIDLIKERWIPEPKPATPKQNELLGKLMESADPGDKQRAGVNAAQFIDVAEKSKLGAAYNKGPDALLGKIDDTLEKLNAKTGSVYDGAGKDVYVANVTGKLREWADDLRKEVGGVRLKDADNIDAVAANIAQAAANANKPTMTPKELRGLITTVQNKAFSGSYLDPTEARAMQRELAGKLRGVLDEHVAANASKADVKKLGDLNKQISALIAFRDAAEKRAAAAQMLPPKPPETRTGFAPVRDAVALANSTEDPAVKQALADELAKQLGAPIVNPNRGKALPSEIRAMANATKDADIRRDMTGALYEQIGSPAAHRLTALEDEAARMSRLEEPLVHLAERGSTPPTTLRHHVGSVKGYLEHGGIGGGLALAATGHVKEGLAIVGATLASKYGAAPFRASERGIAAMVEASRRGATAANLRTLARVSKVPRELAEDAIEMLVPREAATHGNKKGKE